ncbi:hypothetical protein PMIN01_05095 [Paraphaeosphaeria minitans]|uniref:Uncharacterized protein n=1 Tax=Paraphaeosphaeria minitans TaxID=565426 RepID=A0A9P6GKG5_9PLEO|nr:hypothetical protein PMIN01_05095 [Paraphaeosphaeria minitans]
MPRRCAVLRERQRRAPLGCRTGRRILNIKATQTDGPTTCERGGRRCRERANKPQASLLGATPDPRWCGGREEQADWAEGVVDCVESVVVRWERGASAAWSAALRARATALRAWSFRGVVGCVESEGDSAESVELPRRG